MSSNLVIVALPADDESVWKVSSEKKPHLTLAFLGEADTNPNLERIFEFVQHAVDVAEHGPFYMDVDYRGTLGPDDADVLFFEKTGWSAQWITEFRNQLLQNTDIRAAYESVEQYDEWTPHLTLGYPTAPAHADKEPEHGFHMIRFDRIAIWTADSEGEDFRLKWPDRELDQALAMGGTAVADLLEHHGVKGMRWGHRQAKDTQVSVGGKTKMVTAKKADKLDKKWVKNQFTLSKGIERHNAMGREIEAKLPAFNADKRWKDHNGNEINLFGNKKKEKEYFDAYEKEIAHPAFANAVKAVHGTSPSGKSTMTVERKGNDIRMVVKPTSEVKHADISGEEVFLFRITRNANGLVITTKPISDQGDAMQQSTQLVDDILEHVGVKGMRWGQRKDKIVSGAKATGRFVSDVTFEGSANSRSARDLVASKGHKAFKKEDLPKINAKPEYQNAKKLKHRLTNPKDPLTKQYRTEVKTAYVNQLEKAANAQTNSAGTRQYTIRERGIDLPSQGGALPKNSYLWDVTVRNVVHAANDPAAITLEVIMDDDGFVIDVQPAASDTPAQSATHGEVFVDGLMHYGVKGMHWGRRSSGPPSPVAPSASSKVPHGEKRQTKIQTQGGENHPAHEDAIKVAQSRVKLAKSGPAALSNKELKDVANRVRLEQEVKQLVAPSGKKFVTNLLKSQGNQGANLLVGKHVRKAIRV